MQINRILLVASILTLPTIQAAFAGEITPQTSDLSAATTAPVTLSQKWEAGEKFGYVITEKSDSKSSSGERFFGISSSLTLDTTWEVKQVLPDGSARLGVAIDRVRYSASGKGDAAMAQDLVFDSDSKAEPEGQPEKSVAASLKAYVGPVGVVTIDNQGGVTGFSASDELAGVFKGNTIHELAGFYGDLFSRDGLKNRLTNWLVAFPAEPVPIGTVWNQELPSPIGPQVGCSRNYKLVGPEPGVDESDVKIDVISEFKTKMPDIEIGKQSGGKGHISLDRRTHQILAFKLAQNVSFVAAYGMNGNLETTYSAVLQPDEQEGKPKS